MAGLLDFLNNSYGGGLLGGLMYQSPLLQPQEQPAQPQYDAMGNSFGAASIPMTAKDPFGPPPNLEQWAKQFSPQNTPFGANAAAAPFAAPTVFTPGPAVASPQNATQQPAPQAADFPQNNIGIGGYQMPRVGNASGFISQMPTDVSAQSRSPMQPQATAQPPIAAGGMVDRLMAGFQNFANAGGILPALAGGVAGLASGQRTDPAGIQQQNQRDTFNALVPIVGPQKAWLAAVNPEAGKTILAQALEKQQPTFGLVGENSDGSKAYGFIDPTKKQVTPYNTPSNSEDRVVTGPDGKPIPIPPGVDAKTFRNEVSRANAKAAAGEKTEVQAKAEIFANKMETANKEIQDGIGTSLSGKIASGLPLGNYVQSPEYQKYKQASSNFITALLRQESGAAISKSEFDRYDKEYMPQPGDSREVLAQKQEARRIAIEGMKKGAGPGYKSPTASPLPAGWSVSVR